MNFSFTDEQNLLRESVEKLVAAEYPFEVRRELAESEGGFSRALWGKFAELGWLGLGVPEEAGGVGGGPVETAVVMEALGGGLAVEPYLATVVLGASLLKRGGAVQHERLSRLAAGELQVAFGFAERQSRYELASVETRAEPEGRDGFRLTGNEERRVQRPGRGRHRGERTDRGRAAGPRGDHRLRRRRGRPRPRGARVPHDGRNARGRGRPRGRRAGPGDVLGRTGEGIAVTEEAVNAGIVAACAEAAGIMARMHRDTIEYLRHREQFGTALSQFQALQHRLVDMFMACELSRSMAYMAAVRLADPEAGDGELRKAVSAAKVQIGRAGRFVGENAIQLHGGMGMTDEMPISHYFKRLVLIDSQFGDADHHLREMAGTAP